MRAQQAGSCVPLPAAAFAVPLLSLLIISGLCLLLVLMPACQQPAALALTPGVLLLPLSVGLPASNDVTYCSSTSRSCYFLKRVKNLPHASAKATCTAMGGYLVGYNSGTEQLEVEKYFKGTRGCPEPGAGADSGVGAGTHACSTGMITLVLISRVGECVGITGHPLSLDCRARNLPLLM
jgi:hypothetical protein